MAVCILRLLCTFDYTTQFIWNRGVPASWGLLSYVILFGDYNSVRLVLYIFHCVAKPVHYYMHDLLLLIFKVVRTKICLTQSRRLRHTYTRITTIADFLVDYDYDISFILYLHVSSVWWSNNHGMYKVHPCAGLCTPRIVHVPILLTCNFTIELHIHCTSAVHVQYIRFSGMCSINVVMDILPTHSTHTCAALIHWLLTILRNLIMAINKMGFN